MFKNKEVTTYTSAGMLLIVFLAIATFVRSPSTVVATGVLDTPESKEIADVLAQFYALLDAPVETIDASEFAQVLIDSPAYPLTDGQQKFLIQTVGAKGMEQAGYLTYMQYEHRYLQRGQQLLRTALAGAEKDNRSLTAEEVEEIKQQNNGQLPPVLSSNGDQTKVEVESINFEGAQAIVRYHTQPAYEEAIMLNVEGRWYIASIKVIWAHF